MLTSLKQFYLRMARDERKRLLHFSISALVFFICYLLLRWVNDSQPASLQQELYALVLAISMALAFGYAIVLQIIYVIIRITQRP